MLRERKLLLLAKEGERDVCARGEEGGISQEEEEPKKGGNSLSTEKRREEGDGKRGRREVTAGGRVCSFSHITKLEKSNFEIRKQGFSVAISFEKVAIFGESFLEMSGGG